MAAGVSARLTTAQGRRFGLTVGTAFLVFAGIAWWRSHPNATIVLAALGVSLTLAGLIIPTRLGPVERAWMGLAHAMSKVTTPIVMGVIYLIVMTPVGGLRRTLGGNPLVHQPVNDSYWRARPQGKRAGDMKRQF
jgi:hypothetical protein